MIAQIFELFTRCKLFKIGAAFRANACLCEPIAILTTQIKIKLNSAVTSSKMPKDVRSLLPLETMLFDWAIRSERCLHLMTKHRFLLAHYAKKRIIIVKSIKNETKYLH